MFIELVDMLRCPREHEETWLVASVREMVGRHIRTGTLGCPICGSEYPIENGIVRYAPVAPPAGAPSAPPPSDEDAMRLAALLDLTSEGGAVLLGGTRARLGARLALTTGVQVIAVNPSAESDAAAEGVSAIIVDGPLPIAAGALRAAALDPRTQATLGAGSVAHAIRSGGRLVLPADALLPEGVRELARDAVDLVAEREVAPTRPVRLTLNTAPRRA